MLNFVYTKGFGVYYDFGRSFFGDINSDAYNYDIKTERPQGAINSFPIEQSRPVGAIYANIPG